MLSVFNIKVMKKHRWIFYRNVTILLFSLITIQEAFILISKQRIMILVQFASTGFADSIAFILP